MRAINFDCPVCGFDFQLKGQKTPFRSSITDPPSRRTLPPLVDARIEIVRTVSTESSEAPPGFGVRQASAALFITGGSKAPEAWRTPRRYRADSCLKTIIASPAEVREKFRRVKPLADVPVARRGWMLDILNIVRRLGKTRLASQARHELGAPKETFSSRIVVTNQDVYAFERELEKLHPDNPENDSGQVAISATKSGSSFSISPPPDFWSAPGVMSII